MEPIERVTEKYATVLNVNYLRATLNDASEFKVYLEEALTDSNRDIIINLGDCEYMDSTFLGVLVSAYKKLKYQNRNLIIIEPVDQSSIFLTLNSIGKIFPIYSNVKSALEDIEKKKLLEAEINGSGSTVGNKIETQKASFKIGSKLYDDVPDEEVILTMDEQVDSVPNINQETEEEEISVNSFKTDETIEEVSTNYPLPKNKIKEEEGLILIENMDGGEESDDNSITDQEFQLSIESPSNNQGPDEDDVTETAPEPELISADVDYRKGTVEWEFGFN